MRKKNAESREPVNGCVTLSIRSVLYNLQGRWSWELESEAIYVSDVMDFPHQFEGTKSIIHPDDLHNVIGAIDLLSSEAIAQLDFRIITTYGEVKIISGQKVTLERSDAETSTPGEAMPWVESLQQIAARKEAEYLKQRVASTDLAEKFLGIGSWAVNKSTGEAWYSDGVYRIHGLPSQSLNGHFHTFHPFLHPDDRGPFLDAFEAAYEAKVPIHLEYRIVPGGGEATTVRLITQWSYNSRGQAIFTGVLQNTMEEAALEQRTVAAEDKAQLAQQLLHFAESQWNTGYFSINLITRKATYSDNYHRIYGLKGQNLSESSAFINLVHPDDRNRVRAMIARMYDEHQLPEEEFRIVRNDGKQRILRQSGKLMLTSSDMFMIGVVQDLTVQRGLERKIGELNESLALQSLVQGIAESLTKTGFITWNSEGYIRWSEGFYHLLGYKPGSIEPSAKLLQKQVHPYDLKDFKDAMVLVANGQNPPDLRFRITNKAGMRRLVLSFNQVDTGSQRVVLGVVKDLTKEEALHQKLAETTAYGDLLGSTISDMVILTDRDNTVLHWNKAAEEKTSIPATEAIYSNLFDLFPALKEEAYMSRLHTAMAGHEVRESIVHNVYLRKAHHYFLAPLKNEAGEVTRVLHVVQDVSKELDLQQQLSERLTFIESLADASVDRIVVLDRHMNYLYWNKKAEEYYAIAKQEVLGRNILEIFPGLRNDPSYTEFRKVLRGEIVYLPPVLADESTEYFETYLIPIKAEREEVSAILWIVHDLSNEQRLQKAQRNAQQRLEEEHRRLNEAQAMGRVGSFEWMVGTNVTHWSDELYRIHGLAPQSEEITLDKVDQFIHPADFAKLQALREFSQFSPGNFQMTHRIVLCNGDLRWVNHQWECIANENGNVMKVTGVVQDITEKKKAEEEAGNNQELLQATMNSSLDRIQVFKAVRNESGEVVDFRYLLLNHEAEKWMPGALGKTLLQLQPGVVDEGTFDTFKNVVETGIPDQRERHYVHEQFSGWFHQSVVKLNDGVATTTRDITAQKEAVQQLSEQSHYLRRIQETVPDMMSVMELSTRSVHYLNRETFSAHGFDPEAMLAKTSEERLAMIHPDDRPELKKYYEKLAAASDDEIVTAEYRATDLRGEEKWFHVRGKVFQRDAAGQVTHILNAIGNITGWKKTDLQIQESNELLQSVFDTAIHVTTLFDAVRNGAGEVVDFRYKRTNSLGLKFEGLDPAGKLYSELHPGMKQTVVFQNFKSVVDTGGYVDFEFYYNFENVPEGWYRIKAIKFDDGLVAVGEDITSRKNAEEEIKKSLTILAHTEGLAKIGSWEYDLATGHFTWSEGMYHLFGLARGSTVHPETYLHFATEEDKSVAKRIIKCLKKTHQPFEETVHIKRGAEVRLLQIKASAVTDEQGQAQRMVGVDLDITDIKAAEEKVRESQHWLKQTAEASPDAILVYDIKKRTPFYLNSCLAEWLGATNEEFLAMGIEGRLNLVYADDRLKLLHFIEMMKAAADGQILTLEYRIRRKDGFLLWVRSRTKVFQRDATGAVTHILIIQQDVTEEKAAEEVLTQLNASLEKKNQELESKNEEITSFAFVASHDLKEPVRKIQTFSDWMLIRETGLSEDGKQQLQRMISAVKRLDLLIDDVFALTKVHVDNEQMQRVDLAAVVQQLKEETKEKLERTETTIEAGELPVIMAAENQVFYLFKNLVSNAIKFQPKGGKPHIVIQTKKEANYLKLSFTDNGIGVPEEHHKKIFEMFRRLHGRAEYEGTGMGLAICKKIMEKHGGKLTVESKEGEGATFICWFPAALSTK